MLAGLFPACLGMFLGTLSHDVAHSRHFFSAEQSAKLKKKKIYTENI